MNDDSKAMEAASMAVFRSLERIEPDTRANELTSSETAQVALTAVRAYLAQREADGAVMVPVELLQRTVTMRDDFWEQDVIDLLAARPQQEVG